MRFKGYLMRRRGRRLPWRDAMNGPAFVGDLRTHTIAIMPGSATTSPCSRHPTHRQASPVPDLYEPVMLGFSMLALRLRGFERLGSPGERIAVVQEWHCELP